MKFTTSILNSRLCDYSNAYMLVSWNVTIAREEADNAAIAAYKNNK